MLLVAFIEPSWFNALRIIEYVKFGKSLVYVALIIWLVIMFAGVPVGWSLFIAAVLFFSMTRWGTGNFAATKLVDSVNSFGLLSVPFFILTGILMNSAGITTRIFNFALAMLGHYTGGMGHVNIAASLIFSGMSGSALADAGALGQLEIKAMRDAGYEDDLCGGITAASCIIGGIFSGAFTTTEAAVIAALYSIILGMFVYRERTPAGLFTCCVEAMAITGVTVLMVMTVTFFGDMIALERVAMQVASGFMTFADNTLMVLLMINLLLLFLGMFIDASAAIPRAADAHPHRPAVQHRPCLLRRDDYT